MESYPLGPASWPVWLRKLLPYSRRFANAAAFHDWEYDHMGYEWGRRWADLPETSSGTFLVSSESVNPVTQETVPAKYLVIG